ncbi:GAF domain-containing sensor histidine kinase [Halobacillus shinanisalinarum]|uniref:histidine kinase n=1 Tax=Halobacillus shinanisalinarum TaxID=2932258 RepID=A0ABY4H111_9BACI|nr:GAF domain-containing sensor histidine kinase [Halobacillus shinanisalinarum]UOQ92677.1 GAF domain-containing sensor histidine kinase [Halobacillus shinanisalinarum]
MHDATAQIETLKNIAELLNESTNKNVLGNVLRKFISMTAFEAGWIFLEKEDEIQLAADIGLPPALSRDNKRRMCGEDCSCVSRYKSGRLTKATSIIACKRIEQAQEEGLEGTDGITHHATVPLQTPGRSFGLFNVATRNKSSYSEDLHLLESIALQVGTALERIERFEAEEEWSLLLMQSHELTRSIQDAQDLRALKWTVERGLQALYPEKKVQWTNKAVASSAKLCGVISDQEAFYVSGQTFTKAEVEVFELVKKYITVSWKKLVLIEKEKTMARREERSRFAQDLHDSVNQLLFSIVLTSKAASRLSASNPSLKEQVDYIQDISSQALQEMRALIAEEKSGRLKEGVLAELSSYAGTIGLKYSVDSEGTESIPYALEETLLRIGQEALHNVLKHAGTEEVEVSLQKFRHEVVLIIRDHGVGFNRELNPLSFGISGMRERAALYDGRLTVTSEKGEGTVVKVEIPLEGRSGS